MRAGIRIGSVTMILVGCILSVAACSSPVTTPVSSDTDGGGGGGGCDQTCQDTAAGFAIDDLISNLYNEAVAGKPSGTQNATQACPLGGTAVITGSDSVDTSHNLTTVNLTFALTACKAIENGDTLTFDGTITNTGSFDSSTTRSENFASTSLTYKGTIGSTNVAVTACDVHVNDDSNQNPQVTGSICGRAF